MYLFLKLVRNQLWHQLLYCQDPDEAVQIRYVLIRPYTPSGVLLVQTGRSRNQNTLWVQRNTNGQQSQILSNFNKWLSLSFKLTETIKQLTLRTRKAKKWINSSHSISNSKNWGHQLNHIPMTPHLHFYLIKYLTHFYHFPSLSISHLILPLLPQFFIP